MTRLFRLWSSFPALLAAVVCSCSCVLTTHAADTNSTAPLDLQDAIQLALAKNFSIRIEAFDVSIARAQVTASYGKFDPVISLEYNFTENGSPQAVDPTSGERPAGSIVSDDVYSAGLKGLLPWGTQYRVYGNTDNNRGTFNNFAHQYFTTSGIDVQQPLLRDFGLGPGMLEIRIAKTNHSIAEWEQRLNAVNTITDVIFAYLNLYEANENLRHTTRARDLVADLVAENERRFKVGERSESDVTAARARAAQREESVLFAERLVQLQTTALRQLISDEKNPASLSAPLPIASPASLPKLTVNPSADFQFALTERPDYQRSRLLARRTQLNRSYQANQLLPDLTVGASYKYHGLGESWPESRRSMENHDAHSYSAGAALTIPLTFARERGNYRVAKLQQRQAETQVEQLEQQVLVDVLNAATEVQNAERRVEAAHKTRELAQQSLNDQLKLHRVGKIATVLLLQEQDFLLQAELSEATAVTDLHKAVAEYDRRVGRTLERHGVQLDASKTKPVPRS